MKNLFARGLQLLGMATVGLGLIRGMLEEEGLRVELEMLVLGSVMFAAGRFMEGSAAA